MKLSQRESLTVSACVLTFNNAETLDLCLASVRGQVDEIVVIDSGSADRSCAIAATYGARVIVRPFTNFADQRNFGTAQCTGDVVMMIDSDEFIPREFVSVARRWFARGARVLACPRRHLVSLDPPRFLSSRPHYHDWQTRMFLRRAGAAYEGRVHERLRYPGRRVKAGDLHLYHMLFVSASREQRRAKSDAYQTHFGDGYPRFYVFEDAGYTTQAFQSDWGGEVDGLLRTIPVRSTCVPQRNPVRALSLAVRQLPLYLAAYVTCLRSRITTAPSESRGASAPNAPDAEREVH